MVRLRDVCDITVRNANLKENELIDYIDIASVDNLEKKVTAYTTVCFKDAPSRARKLVNKKDIIVSTVRPNLNAVAKIDFDTINKTVVSTGFCVLRCSESVLVDYVFHFCKSRRFVETLMEKATGASYPAVSDKVIYDVNIPMLPLKKQNQIAKRLNVLDVVIAKRKQQLKKLDELIKARFVEMFGDPISNSKSLKELPLCELGELGRGVSKHRPRNAPELLGGEYPLIQTGDVANAELYIESYNSTYSELGLKQSKMWNAGTLCITIAANIAKTAILKFDACFPDSVVGFNSNSNTNNIFMHYWFTFFQSILEAQAPESAQKNINLKILGELKVIVPLVEEQNEFVDFVQQIDKSKLSVQKSLDKLEILKKTLMQKYFG